MMTKTYRQSLGSWGEQAAVEFLQGLGYAILGQNVRTPYGEIDLVTRLDKPMLVSRPDNAQGPVVVFVEVKTRTSTSFGLPEESITQRKKEHLLASIQAYMQEHPELPTDWRLDVIAIQRDRQTQAVEITHFENAIY